MVPVQVSDETEPDDNCSVDGVLALMTEALGAEDISTLKDRFLLEDFQVPLLQMSEAEMIAILSGCASPQPPKKKWRLPGVRKVTRKLANIFDLSVYNKRDEQAYKQY